MHAIFASAASGASPILLSADFRTLSAGSPSLPSGWSVTRATTNTFVQTDASTLMPVASANSARVGRYASTDPLALLIEPAMTNLVAGSKWHDFRANGWAAPGGGASPSVYPYVGVLGPDGVTSISEIYSAAGSYGPYQSPGLTGDNAISMWVRALSGTALYCVTPASTIYDLPGYDYAGTVGTTWHRTFISGSGSVGNIVASESRGVLRPFDTTAHHHLVGFVQFEARRYATSFYGGTRAGDQLQFNATQKLVNGSGRFAPSITFRALCAPGDLEGVSYLWRYDASTYARIDPSTQKLTITAGGASQTFATPLIWSAGDIVEVFPVAGGGPLSASYEVNNSGGIYLGASSASSTSLSGMSGPIDLMNAAGASQFPGWLEKMEFYK